MVYRRAVIGMALCLLLVGFQMARDQAWADDAARPWVSRIFSLQGRVVTKRLGDSEWRPAGLEDKLFAGDQIRVEANSRAGVVLSNDAVLRLDQDTTLVFTEVQQPTTFIIRLLRGAANFFSHRPHSLKIVTPFVNGVVEGTEFYVQVDAQQARIDLFEGRIRAENENGTLQMVKGQRAVASATQAPRVQVLVHPRDSVQWALYYPPILALGKDQGPLPIRESIEMYDQGRPAEALDRLEATPQSDRDSRFFVYRAGLMLNVGRVDQALDDIHRALTLDGVNSDALALQAVIAVVQNRKEEALEHAEEAVLRNPRSASAHIALSFAHQAQFNLADALQDAQTAVSNAPDNGTAWARLAELQLSTGESDRGVESARKAAWLNPRIAHAHVILGFAYLTRIKTREAQEAFSRAIALDSAAPLPRLGMGLATIRNGDLALGRAQIEIAAGLAPSNALIRSYLGKAYFDEKRGPLDQREFEIAKSLDPGDPTAWFYDAIRKQTLNQPVEALLDLEKSIELNDNRVVYRSRLLLDEDLAARSASLGRIYNDLAFQHLALTEGYKSLRSDSTNYSAHRLLADSYAAKPRHEIARVSELLQSQLFQQLNLTPIQPNLAESESKIITGAGPGGLSFNEFNPLFMRNRLAFQASSIRGYNNTWGDEFAGSGLFNGTSGSIGSFHYETDGFRTNNDVSKDIVDVFLQGSLTGETSIQAEYRESKVESGDLSQNFNDGFSEFFRENKKVRKYRVGGHHAFTPMLQMIMSYVHTNVDIEQKDSTAGFPSIDQLLLRERVGDLIEARWDYNSRRLKLIAGIGYLNDNVEESLNIFIGPPVSLPINDPKKKEKIKKSNIYAYTHIKPFKNIHVTAGLSADSFEMGNQLESNQINPKLGLVWQPSTQTSVRLAAFRVLSSTLVSTQTIEPTNVSGFNQFYEEQHGTDVKQYGIAIQHKFVPSLSGGIEASKRYLDVPQYGATGSNGPISIFNWEEFTGSVYLYWMPIHFAALSAEYQFEQFDRKENSISSGIVDLDTHRVPLSLSLFHPSGLSYKFVATYILQDGNFEDAVSGNNYAGEDNFWLCDSEINFRLPRRYGNLSIGINNLFDLEFHYQGTDQANPVVTKERFAYAKFSLSF